METIESNCSRGNRLRGGGPFIEGVTVMGVSALKLSRPGIGVVGWSPGLEDHINSWGMAFHMLGLQNIVMRLYTNTASPVIFQGVIN